MRTIKTILGVTAILGALAVAMPSAQTALTTTTLSSAQLPGAVPMAAGADYVNLTSATGVTVGTELVIDNEAQIVDATTPISTRFRVRRGQGGTTAEFGHASGANVFVGTPSQFYPQNRVASGACVSTANISAPRVMVGSNGVTVQMCPAVSTLAGSAAGVWGVVRLNGQAYSGYANTGWTYATAGALTIQPGVQYIGSAGALAMTLAAPEKWQDGMTMTLIASTAQAHTVTYTAGFWGNTTSSDVATFGGAIGDQFTVVAIGGVWRPVNIRNVTLA